MMSSSQLFDGFNILYYKYNESSNVIRQLFFKEHSVKEDNKAKPKGRTLFVINVPPFASVNCMKNLFSGCGAIHDVIFHNKPNSSVPIKKKSKYFVDHEEDCLEGYKVAYVVFTKELSLKNALQLANTNETPKVLCSNDSHLVGLDLWRAQYNDSIVNVDELQNEIDKYISNYDKKIEKEKQIAKEKEGIPDEEGWIKVTKHGKKSYLANKESSDNKIISKMEKKKKQLENFYSFQIRETKINHLTQLRKKFEEDKKRIAIMKAGRKFKPF